MHKYFDDFVNCFEVFEKQRKQKLCKQKKNSRNKTFKLN